MKTLSFRMDPYLNNDGTVNQEWMILALYADEERIDYSEVNFYQWNKAEEHIQEDARFDLTLKIWDKIGRGWSGAEYAFPSDEEYQKWYEWMWFIDGEDAKEFLRYYPSAKHSTHLQTMMGASVGWKYFKVLQEHEFNTHTSAKLAYVRGYLAGMEANSVFDSEGLEALHCLGLDVLRPLGCDESDSHFLME